MKPREVLAAIRGQLQSQAEPHKLAEMHRFFKEPIDAYCVYTQPVRAIAKSHAAAFAVWSPEERDELTEGLWSSGKFEEGSIAIFLYARMVRQCGPAEWEKFASWLDGPVANWAHCDSLCADVLGPLLIRHPEWIRKLRAWSRSRAVYKRRAAIVAPLKGIRKGMFREELESLVAALGAPSEPILKKAIVWARAELAGR